MVSEMVNIYAFYIGVGGVTNNSKTKGGYLKVSCVGGGGEIRKKQRIPRYRGVSISHL